MTPSRGTLWNYTCSDRGLILPLVNEFTWSIELRAFLYLLGMIYCFFGVTIVADIFMCSIETITSKTKRIIIHNGEGSREIVNVKVWNDTVANLTLMALGSSAPEIILSSYEIIGDNFKSGELGPGSVVGAAAFNLLIVTAVCVISIPGEEVRKINSIKVFYMTSFFSVFAYVWLVIILNAVSPNQVEVWEALLTLAFCPIMVFTAYLTDKNFFYKNVKQTQEQISDNNAAKRNSTGGFDDLYVTNFLKRVRRQSDLSKEEVACLTAAHILENQHHSRMWYRVGAIREITGGRRPQLRLNSKLKKVLEDITSDGLEMQQVLDIPDRKAVIEFTKEYCEVLENVGTVAIEIQRRGRLNEPITCHCETMDGTAVAREDYVPKNEDLIFLPHEELKTVHLEIVDDNQWEPDENFFFKLTVDNDNSTTIIGSKSIMKITILNDDEPGAIEFQNEVVKVNGLPVVPIAVMRKNGADGIVTVRWRTRDQSAVSGKDFHGGEGVLRFQHGETRMNIEVQIVEGQQRNGQFFHIELVDTTGGAVLGEIKKVAVTMVQENTDEQSDLRLAESLTKENVEAIKIESESWTAQLKDALNVNGGDLEKATPGDYAMHYLTFHWKVLFALIPPTNYYGGWLTFSFSLFFIGLLTAIVGDLASIFGCLVGLKDSVTAVTFVALGTSLPDLFASRAAAKHEAYADSAVGNVNGSNAVNVFLGLGLSWTIAAVYWACKGLPFKVDAGSLAFSVSVYAVCSVVCMVLMMARRFLPIFGKGELGGPRRLARMTAAFLVALWMFYILISSLQAYGHI